MNIFDTIHAEIDELSDRRTALWHRLSQGRDLDVAAQIKTIDVRLAFLWNEQREIRARIRFGEREDIVRRARAEERLERAA